MTTTPAGAQSRFQNGGYWGLGDDAPPGAAVTISGPLFEGHAQPGDIAIVPLALWSRMGNRSAPRLHTAPSADRGR